MNGLASVDHHCAIIRLLKPDGEIAGLGVLVDAWRVLTCAHVVNVALGVANRYESDMPDTTRLMRVDFPFVDGAPRFTATLVESSWAPPPPSFGGSGHDVAVLELREDSEDRSEGNLPPVAKAPEGADPAIFSWDPGPRKGSLWVFGYPGKPPRTEGMPVDLAVWGKLPGGLIVVQSTTDQSVKAQPGYSGSPVWRDDPAEVVGLLHAAPPADVAERDGYVVPTETIATAWPEFAAVATPANPYRALLPFTAEDSTSFFGREAETHVLYDGIMKRTVTVVSGASGVGKSSLVQAGLIPLLRVRPVEDRPWVVAQFRPGQKPLLHLAAALLRAERKVTAAAGVPSMKEARDKATELGEDGLAPTFEYFRSVGHELLIIADQFEEAWTASKKDRAALIDLLLRKDDDEEDEPPVRIVLTIRSDVLVELQDQPGMGPRLADRLMPLSPLTKAAVLEAVEKPSTDRGVRFEGDLVEEIVKDAGTPVSLPLLQFTLHELWQQQDRRTLTREAYTALGTVGGALDRYADEAFAKLDDHSQSAADRILLRMVRTIPSERQLTTRQRITKTDLNGQDLVVKRLVDSRLVEADGDYLELAHEALITSWGRLRRLVDDNAKFLNWQETMRGRLPDDPLPESRLVEAEQWVKARGAEIPRKDLDLIRASRQAMDTRRAEQARAQLAENERARALEVAESLRLASEAADTAASEADVALLAAWEGVLQDRNEYSESVFRDVLARLPAVVDVLVRADDHLTIGFLGSGTAFAASVSGDLWLSRFAESPDTKRLLIPGEGDLVVARTPNGTGLLLYRDGMMRAYDPAVALATREDGHLPPALDEITLSGADPEQDADSLRINITVSSRGTCLVRDGDFGWLIDLANPWSVIRKYRFAKARSIVYEEFMRLATEEPDTLRAVLKENQTLHHEDRLFRAELDPSGEFVVTEADASARIFPVDGTPPTPLAVDGGIASTCVLADGAVVTGSMGGEGAIWAIDGSRRELFREPSEGRDLFIKAVDPSRMRFATTVNTTSVVDVRDASGNTIASYHGHDGEQFWSAAFSPDGRLLACGSSGRTVRVWEIGGGGEPYVLSGHSTTVDTVEFHPQHPELLLSSDQNGEVRLWRLNPSGLGEWTSAHTGIERLEAIVPGAVVSSDRASAKVWSKDGMSNDLGGPLLDIIESPAENKTLVLTDAQALRTRLWSLEQGTQEESVLLAPRTGGPGASRSVIAPGGRQVLHVRGGLADLQTVETGVLVPLDRGDIDDDFGLDPGHRQYVGQGFRPDGARVVMAAQNGGAWIWTSEGERVGSFVTDHGSPDRTFDLACDPQGDYIATGVRNEVGLWNWDGDKVGVLRVSGYKVFRVSWSPDGERIVTIADNPGGGTALELWTREQKRISTLDWVRAWPWDVPRFDRKGRYWLTPSGAAITIIGRDGERLGLLARPRGTSLVGRGAISLDGNFVAASFTDGTALIWSLVQRRRIKTLQIGDHSALAFSPDGRALLAGRSSGVISRFALEIDDLFPSAAKRVTRMLTSEELDRLGIARSRLTMEMMNDYRRVT